MITERRTLRRQEQMVDLDSPHARPQLMIDGVRKSFGQTMVLSDVTMSVVHGSITAVLGPSGGGKTTLLRIVAGFERPDGGRVSIGGELVAGDGTDVAPERRRVGMVPQEGALFPHLDVGQNVGFGLPRGANGELRIAELLELVGLPGMQRRRPAELSGGQQHRVALARALAPSPAILVLDEPFSSLDAALRIQVRDEVVASIRATGTTAIIVTHDQSEALSCADEVAVLLDGRIAQSSDPVSLYSEPSSLSVASFIGEANVLDGIVIDATTVHCALGRIDARVIDDAMDTHPTPQVVVRPEHLVVTPLADEDTAPGASGTIASCAYFGHDAMLKVILADGTTVLARASDRGPLPAIGTSVAVSVTGVAHCFR